MTLQEPDHHQIERLMELDVDALYSLLPAYDAAQEGTVFSREEWNKAGRAIFESLKGRIDEKICVEWDFCKKRTAQQYQDNITLVASVADVLAALSTGIPPFVIAALVVKIGLTHFCRCEP